jgi:Na+-transporting methylmalonyl-CoA/oxaloacetate decarboxylase gamma subunit
MKQKNNLPKAVEYYVYYKVFGAGFVLGVLSILALIAVFS